MLKNLEFFKKIGINESQFETELLTRLKHAQLLNTAFNSINYKHDFTLSELSEIYSKKLIRKINGFSTTNEQLDHSQPVNLKSLSLDDRKFDSINSLVKQAIQEFAIERHFKYIKNMKFLPEWQKRS